MKLRAIYAVPVVGLLILSMSLIPIDAQADCVALIQSALSELENICSTAGGGAVCAGGATSISGSSVDPGTVMGLDTVDEISTQAVDAAANSFGLAVANVFADVPLVLSETGLRFVLVGNVTLENNVAADEAVVPAESAKVTAIAASNLRASPSTNGTVIDSVPVGTELDVYGLSSDQTWLRALYQDAGVWISRQVVTTTEGELNTLPVLNDSRLSLMQSFTLHTGTEQSDCIGVPPSLLLVQGPQNFLSRILVNGAEIQFEGTIALRMLPDNMMQLTSLSGGANAGGISVPPGFTMTVSVGADNVVDGLWTGLRPISSSERAFLSPLENLPEAVMNTALQIPTAEQVAQTLASLNTASIGQTVQGPASGQASCSGFRPTSPLTAMPNRPDAPFFWDAAAGATGYRINIYDSSGALLRSFDTNANSLTFVIDTTPGGLGNGSNFSWDVAALVNGEVACTSGRVSVLRDANVQAVGDNTGGAARPTPTACPWASCN